MSKRGLGLSEKLVAQEKEMIEAQEFPEFLTIPAYRELLSLEEGNTSPDA